MRRVMNHVVAKIAEEEAAKGSGGELSEEAEKRQIKNRRNWNAEGWRRDQTAGILRIIVMRAVHQKVDPFPETAFRFVMKEEAMHREFDKAPDQQAKDKETGRRGNR